MAEKRKLSEQAQNPLVLGAQVSAFPAFHPRWPWAGGDLQTVRNTLVYRVPDFSPYPARRLLLPMADGSHDQLWATFNVPKVDSPKPVIVLVHGLTGSEDSRNIMASAAYFLGRGHPVVRLNMRGAGPSLGRCSGHTHAGRSADIRDALAALPTEISAGGILLVGVSLGGNVCLKFLGENVGTNNVIAAAAVCAPIDLQAAQRRIGATRNAIYQRHLLRAMRAEAAVGMPETAAALAKVSSVYAFDDEIVAPHNGFSGAEDYYRRCSAAPLLASIQVPTLLVHSRTDPWVPAAMYLDRTWKNDGPLTVLLSPDGGHVGFHAADNDAAWHDRCISSFFAYILAR